MIFIFRNRGFLDSRPQPLQCCAVCIYINDIYIGQEAIQKNAFPVSKHVFSN
jgi:hypothetical protein